VNSPVNAVILGAVGMGALIIAALFYRYWRATRDRFFLLFALSFAIRAANRVALAFAAHPNEGTPENYLVRLAAFLLIIIAVVDKNRAPRPGGPPR
jgi:hypothetical protein